MDNKRKGSGECLKADIVFINGEVITVDQKIQSQKPWQLKEIASRQSERIRK